MKHADFHIGLEFVGSAGFRWRCTDVGTRTILAIHLDRGNPHWYQGPPYIAKEVVFDEHEIESCHLTQDAALVATIHEHNSSGHPGYPAEVVRQMLEARHAHRYPNHGVLRFDRRRQSDGEILHPYAGRKDGEDWMVELYLPFQGTYDVMPERDFITLPRASAKDVRVRADQRRDA
ncbi:hypothetical protein [Oleiagrimonas sp. C23AA]|uniref:hypothetical protein n=1 Tax=Oleiagrimonas sp. C23AA TaxID=2719047 RepID=UPI0014246B33|nr:hypothetical protein [Oleiagrimonas sp. C23AA]NII11052.1 hypothetical protein [Oleiagrimonas sp. C23AA]